ncbi:hypothetical protein ACTFIZ_010851 [Dictyostelium cf. discoideum]
MKYIKLILIFICLFLNYKSIGAVEKPLSNSETIVAKSILKSLYNIETNNFEEVCDYNGCFRCSKLSGSISYTVTSINMQNSLNNFVVTQNLSVFQNLNQLIIGEKVELPTSFFNGSFSKLNTLQYLEISNQKQPFPDKFVIPNELFYAIFNTISVPLSPIWFDANINSLYVVKTLPGFKYPNLTNKTSKVGALILTVNHIDSNVPSMNLFPNLRSLTFNIYNEKFQPGYKNFSIDSINQDYKRVKGLGFNFFNSGNDATIQKFTLKQSFISKFKLESLILNGIGFTVDSSIGYLNFSMMSEGGFKLIINGGCDLVNECKVSNCIVMPTLTNPSQHSFNNIRITGCITPSLTPIPINS